MSKPDMELLMMRGLVSQMPPETRQKIEDCRAKLETVINDTGDEGKMAMCLLALEFAAKEGV